MSSYERVLICSSGKFYWAYFNKIYSSSSEFRSVLFQSTESHETEHRKAYQEYLENKLQEHFNKLC